MALPVVTARGWDDTGAEVEADDEDDFSLSRSGPMTVEELDLAPMVDVAFQLVLFFMVTATTVLYKTLEIPKPTTEQAPSAVAQGRSRTLDDLKDDYILVEIDASGAMKIDREPVAAEHERSGGAAADSARENRPQGDVALGRLCHAAPQLGAGLRRGQRDRSGHRDRAPRESAGALRRACAGATGRASGLAARRLCSQLNLDRHIDRK